jgi:hypothetical protein
LLYLFDVEPTREIEKDILNDGLFRLRENYTLGCSLAFLDRYEDKAVTLYVDNNITDGWTHLPHFVMVTRATDKFYDVFDPWGGKVVKISKDRLINGIELLRGHVKVCPFVITANVI